MRQSQQVDAYFKEKPPTQHPIFTPLLPNVGKVAGANEEESQPSSILKKGTAPVRWRDALRCRTPLTPRDSRA